MTKERYIEILEIALGIFKRTMTPTEWGHKVFVRDPPVFFAYPMDLEDDFASMTVRCTVVTFTPTGPVISRS